MSLVSQLAKLAEESSVLYGSPSSDGRPSQPKEALMPDPDRPVTISYTIQEAAEMAAAAEASKTYVDHDSVSTAVERTREAVRAAEETGAV